MGLFGLGRKKEKATSFHKHNIKPKKNQRKRKKTKKI